MVPSKVVSEIGTGDRDLAARCLAGDRDAFEALYRQHVGRLYNLAWRMSGSGEDADDLVQDIFLQAYRKLGSYKGESSLGTWLYRLAVNLCLDRLRSKAGKMEKVTDSHRRGGCRPGGGARIAGGAEHRADGPREGDRHPAPELPRDVRAPRRRGLPARRDRPDAGHQRGQLEVAAAQGEDEVEAGARTVEAETSGAFSGAYPVSTVEELGGCFENPPEVFLAIRSGDFSVIGRPRRSANGDGQRSRRLSTVAL